MPFDGENWKPQQKPYENLHERSLERLRFSREQIAAGRWCQGDFEDGAGEKRCATGWLGWNEPADHRFVYAYALPFLWRALPPSARRTNWEGHRCQSRCMTHNVAAYNDHHTQKTVVKLFDRAIAALEAG
jgi:hypothetical protein